MIGDLNVKQRIRQEEFLLFAIVTAIPLFFLLSVRMSFTITKATLLWLLSFVVLSFILKKINVLKNKNALILVSVTLFITFLSTMFSDIPYKTVLGERQRYEGLLTVLSYMTIFYFASATRVNNKKIIFWLILGSVPISIYGLLQYFGWDFYVGVAPDWSGNRSYSTFGQPTVLGTYLNLIVPLTAVALIDSKKRLKTGFFFMAGTLALACLVTTFTRGAWLGVLISASLLSIKLKHIPVNRQKVLLFFSGFLVLLLAILSYSYANKDSVSVGKRIGESLDYGIPAPRLFMWDGTVRIIADKPLTGWGKDTFRTIYPGYRAAGSMTVDPNWDETNPHNLILEYTYSTGILGLVSLLWILIYVFFLFLRRFSENTMSDLLIYGFVSSLVGYLVALQFEITAVGVMPLFWLMLGMLVHACSEKKQSYIVADANQFQRMKFGIRYAVAYLTLLLAPISLLPFVAEVYKERAFVNMDVNDLKTAKLLNPFDETYLNDEAQFYKQTDPFKASIIYADSIKKNPRNWETYLKAANFYMSGAVSNKSLIPIAENLIKSAKEHNPHGKEIKAAEEQLNYLKDSI